MKEIIFVHPNTPDGAGSRNSFLQEIRDFNITRSIQTLPCLENRASIRGNVDITEILKPKLILFSNEFSLTTISLYTDILYKKVQNEKDPLHKSFFLLTYKNQHFASKELSSQLFKNEVDEYYFDLIDMVADIEQQLLNLKAFQERP